MWKTVAACLTLLSLVITSHAEGPKITRKQIDAYIESKPLESYGSDVSTDWEDRLYRLLSANRDADAVAEALSKIDAVSVAHEKAFISLWLKRAELEQRLDDGRLTPKEHKSALRALESPAIAAIRGAHYSRVFVAAAARMFGDDDYCDASFLDALMINTADPLDTGLIAVGEADCSSWWIALYRRFPENTALAVEMIRRLGELRLPLRLALHDKVSRSQLAPNAAMSTRLELISDHWRAGLISEGFAILDGTSATDRDLLLSDSRLSNFRIDDHEFDAAGQDRGQAFAERSADFRLDYIAALFLKGNIEEARKRFEALPYTPQMRPIWNCDPDALRIGRDDSDCARLSKPPLWLRWSLLDSILNRPDDDPYILAEAAFVGRTGRSIGVAESALWTELAQRLFAGGNYSQLRREFAEQWFRGYSRGDSVSDVVVSALDTGLQQEARRYENHISQLLRTWGVKSNEGLRVRKDTSPALPRGYREMPLSKALRSSPRKTKDAKSQWPKNVAPLPEGFFPTRLEQGETTVAVSLSQNLDPTGEVSLGGYWIHLSHDGGRSWLPPIYTGLAEFFPYWVPPDSKMRLWAGDRIRMEVEVRELDRSSITYPPIALRSRRQERNLYLEMPLAALQSDRDGDGLTDIVEERLLLNPDAADTDGDGLDDSHDPTPNIPNGLQANLANAGFATILKHIFGLDIGVLVEPVDRDSNPENIFQFQAMQARDLWSVGRPIILRGEPADFAGLLPPSVMLVYSESDVERMSEKSPVFHPLSLETVIFNRAGNRGYASWTMRWTGGTVRLIREEKGWRVEDINLWIT